MCVQVSACAQREIVILQSEAIFCQYTAAPLTDVIYLTVEEKTPHTLTHHKPTNMHFISCHLKQISLLTESLFQTQELSLTLDNIQTSLCHLTATYPHCSYQHSHHMPEHMAAVSGCQLPNQKLKNEPTDHLQYTSH